MPKISLSGRQSVQTKNNETSKSDPKYDQIFNTNSSTLKNQEEIRSDVIYKDEVVAFRQSTEGFLQISLKQNRQKDIQARFL